MVRPTLHTVLLLTVCLAAALLPSVFDGRLWMVWCAATATVLLAAGIDGVAGLRRRDLDVRIDAPTTLYIGDADPLTVRLVATGRAPRTDVEALLEVDERLVAGPPITADVRTAATTEIRFTLRPRRRGTARVTDLWLRWTGPLGLMRRTSRVAVDREIPVIPDVRAVKTAAIRRFGARDAVSGLKTERYLGDGTEFDSLREYLPGHDHRAIDWKASARHVKLIAREYRAERNHQIVMAFDTGHLMTEPLDGVPRIDHGINAALMLAYAGLKTGDRVGLFAFDEAVRLFEKPSGGMKAFAALKARTTDIRYSTGETNFTLGIMTLLGQLRRRTLVVLFTEFTDTVTVELMVENVRRLTARHLVICVTNRDEGLLRHAAARPDGLGGLNRAVVAADLLRERAVVLRRLARLGVHCIDAPVGGVSAALVDRYLEIKRRELI